MKIGELRKVAKEWQSRLGLDHWKIEVRHGKEGEMDPSWCACVTWSCEYHSAFILVHKNHCTEHSIVHELLHVRLEGHLVKPLKYDSMYEFSLNHITDTLIGYPEKN